MYVLDRPYEPIRSHNRTSQAMRVTACRAVCPTRGMVGQKLAQDFVMGRNMRQIIVTVSRTRSVREYKIAQCGM